MSGPTTINVDDWWEHRAFDPDAHAELLAWVEGVIGQPIGWERTLTLGEGVMVVERFRLDGSGRPIADPRTWEAAIDKETYPAPTAPPCWPAGIARKEPT